MKPQIDFYVSKDTTAQSALSTVCRIAEKAFNAGFKIHICTQDDLDTETLDTLLWTYRDRSFLPHEIFFDSHTDSPITISTEFGPADADMLINTSSKTPKNIEQFQRIAEIIDNQDKSIRAGRERYRFYREQGYDPQHHEVSST